MNDKERILQAHVQFELARWQEGSLPSTLRAELDELFGWLGTVSLGDLLPAPALTAAVRRLLSDAPTPDGVQVVVEQVLHQVYEVLRDEPATAAELVPREDYDEVVTRVIDMRRLRQLVLDQLTTSTVYSRLISHVMYQGIKNYVLNDSLVVRKVPGASSLLRMGQNAVRSATPNLERSIDQKLVSFVSGNIQDIVRDSKDFLDDLLDEATLRTIAEQLWQENSERSLADTAALVDASTLDELADTATTLWLDLRENPTFLDLVERLVEEYLQANGETPVADLLAEYDVAVELVLEHLTPVMKTIIARARQDGALEAYLRRRLDAFYSSYFRDFSDSPDFPP